MVRLFLILVLFSLSNYALSQTDTIVRSSMDARAESYSHYELSNLKVTEIYNKIITLFTSVNNSHSNYYKEKIINSHEAWSIYSSDHCLIELYQSREAASGGDIFYHNCITVLNERRIKELDQLLINLQGEFNE